MLRRGSLLLLALLPLLAVALAGLGVSAPGRTSALARPAAPATPGPPLMGPADAAIRQLGDAFARSLDASLADLARRRAEARRAELRRLRRSRTVEGALRLAWLTHGIDSRAHEDMRRTWLAANRDVQRLRGQRRDELAAVIAMAGRLAATRQLTASRLEPVFLTLQRNRELWTRAGPPPQPGARMTFGRDPVIFQYYSGRGVAIQPLANFGRANALADSCLLLASRYRCRPAALARLLDRMVALGAVRGGFLAWEHYFAFGSGAPPWISGMTQATGAQALARGRRAIGARGAPYTRAARRALGAFEAAPPLGVAVRTGGGLRYPMYSFAPGLRILNGELQAVIGLHDVAQLTGSAGARGVYVRGERATRRAVRAFDTGAWSLYSSGGAESTLDYHRLAAGFLAGLCTRTGRSAYCTTGRHFARYVREPPRVRLRALRRLRVRRASAITFTLSKVSDVTVRVRDRSGRVELARVLRLARGRHSLRWMPLLRGRHTLRIVAIGPAGTRAVVQRTVRAQPARKQRTRREAQREKVDSRSGRMGTVRLSPYRPAGRLDGRTSATGA